MGATTKTALILSQAIIDVPTRMGVLVIPLVLRILLERLELLGRGRLEPLLLRLLPPEVVSLLVVFPGTEPSYMSPDGNLPVLILSVNGLRLSAIAIAEAPPVGITASWVSLTTSKSLMISSMRFTFAE